MRIVKVIESWMWVHDTTGQRVSMYGAVPWRSEAERHEWALVHVGFTWQRSDGCVGICREPAETRTEAETVMAEFNARFAPRTVGAS